MMQQRQAGTEAMTHLVQGVDHITIRVDDARYDHLYSLFAETFRLPIAWPVAERYPGAEIGWTPKTRATPEPPRAGHGVGRGIVRPRRAWAQRTSGNRATGCSPLWAHAATLQAHPGCADRGQSLDWR
jgi:hypothetical protein